MRCPEHRKERLEVCKGWKPYEGLDPKMRRYTCIDCSEYWYKVPKHCLKRWEEVQVEFELLPAKRERSREKQRR
jgi:hypothetical protein